MKPTHTAVSISLVIILAAILCILFFFPKISDFSFFSDKDPFKNVTYTIDGNPVKVRYFGNEVKLDFDKDGREDIAFIATHSPGGSGTFYYVVMALNTVEGYKSGEGFFLGDRIAPQSTELTRGNAIIVNYADRKDGEGFSAQPSLGKSKLLLFDLKTMKFDEVVYMGSTK